MITIAEGFSRFRVRSTARVKSMGQKMTFTLSGALFRAISCPVVVVVLKIYFRSGLTAFHSLSRVRAKFVSPTLTAWIQIAPCQSFSSFFRSLEKIPNRSQYVFFQPLLRINLTINPGMKKRKAIGKSSL